MSFFKGWKRLQPFCYHYRGACSKQNLERQSQLQKPQVIITTFLQLFTFKANEVSQYPG